MWLERRPYGDTDTGDLRMVTDHWPKLGVHIPKRFSEAIAEPRDDTAPLIYNHSDAPAERVSNLALGIVASCDGRNVEDSTHGLDYFTAQRWLILNSGLPSTDSGSTDGLKPFIDKPMSEQVKLFNSALAAWSCR